jgi:hypothetical protein
MTFIKQPTTTLPTGKLKGALPEKLIINGVHWLCVKTEVIGNDTFDTFVNQVTGERKKNNRKKTINFLHGIR